MVCAGTIKGLIEALQIVEAESFTPKFHAAVHHDLIDKRLTTAGGEYIVRVTLLDECEKCIPGIRLLSVACIGLSLDQQHFCGTHQGHISDTQGHIRYPEFPVHEWEPGSVRVEGDRELGVRSGGVPQLLTDIRIGNQVKQPAVDGLGVCTDVC